MLRSFYIYVINSLKLEIGLDSARKSQVKCKVCKALGKNTDAYTWELPEIKRLYSPKHNLLLSLWSSLPEPARANMLDYGSRVI